MSLIDDAKAARAAGLTYGQYMTQREFTPPQKPAGKRCANCGGVLHGKRLTFCCNECREELKRKTARGDLFV